MARYFYCHVNSLIKMQSLLAASWNDGTPACYLKPRGGAASWLGGAALMEKKEAVKFFAAAVLQNLYMRGIFSSVHNKFHSYSQVEMKSLYYSIVSVACFSLSRPFRVMHRSNGQKNNLQTCKKSCLCRHIAWRFAPVIKQAETKGIWSDCSERNA